MSAISQVRSTDWQNAKTLEDCRDRLTQIGLPVSRGIELTADDLARRAVIQALACQLTLSMESIGIAHLVDFREYFTWEISALEPFVRDCLVEMDDEWLVVTPAGRLVVRAICAVFDRYLTRTPDSMQAPVGEPVGERYSAVF